MYVNIARVPNHWGGDQHWDVHHLVLGKTDFIYIYLFISQLVMFKFKIFFETKNY